MANYKVLTPEAAARIAGEFEISEFADDLFGLVQKTANGCQWIDGRPTHAQKRKALDVILKTLCKLRQTLKTYQHVHTRAGPRAL